MMLKTFGYGPMVAVLAAASGCEPSTVEFDDHRTGEVSQDVLGGSYEPNDRYPWVVRMTTGCHGVLIHPEWVLTAAHCVAGTVGDFVAPPNQAEQQVRQARVVYEDGIYVHPDYDACSGLCVALNDIALVHLKKPFQITANVQTVALPPHSLAPGDRGRIASERDHGDGETPEGHLSVYEGAVFDCGRSEEGVFCTREDNSVACRGDSGSGFFGSAKENGRERATVFGVASYVEYLADEGLCTEGNTVGFTDVYHHRDWIVNTLAARGYELGGNVAMVRAGLDSEGVMRLECQDGSQEPIWAEAPMDLEGVELSLDCGPSSVVEATCDLRGLPPDREIDALSREGALGTVEELAHTPDFAYWWEYTPGSVVPRTYRCDVALPPALYVPLM